MTLEGINLVATSVGIYGINRNEVVFRDAEIKRFDTGLWLKGGKRSAWKDLYLSGCNINAKLHGDTDVGTTNWGDVFRHNEWIGGKCELANTDGLQLWYKDKRCSHFAIRDVGFENCPGMALRINGARYGTFEGCWWIGNTGHIDIHDDANAGNAPRVDTTCLDLPFRRCSIACSAKRPASTMLYDTRTATFTVGTVLTGQSSGATARLLADTNGAGTGTLTLKDIKGVFTVGETITDSSGGSGRCAGAQVDQAAVLLGAVLAVRPARQDDVAWVANIDVQGGDVRVTVTGKAATTIEWTVDVYLVTT